jgi:glucosamine kinase
MNETLPVNIRKKFVQRYDADRKTLLEKVYRKKQPAFIPQFVQRFFSGEQKRRLS